MKKNERKHRRLYQWTAVALCVLMVVTLLASCGKAMDRSEGMIAEDYLENSANADKPSSEGASGKDNFADTSDTSSPSGEYEVKIIRTAHLTAETKTFDAALAEIETSVATLGGYIQNSDVSGRNNDGYGNCRATMTLRIPAEKLDEFLAKTGTLVNVVSSSTSADDVSGQYYDIEARLSVLETERAVLEKMLAASTGVNEMISVEKRLYDVIYEIESYKTQLKVYDSKIAYATVHITLREVANLTVIADDPTFGARFSQAVSESWQNFVTFCKDFVIWLVYALPTLILLCVMGVLAAVAVVRIRKKRAKKKEEKKEEGQS